jgi:hypothetical protein
VQVLLRRRRADLSASLLGWETLVQAGDPGAVPARPSDLIRGYADVTLPRLRDEGLARVWSGLAIGGADPAQLGRRVAGLCRLLGDLVRPLGLEELAEWLRDWWGGPDVVRPLDARRPVTADELAPPSLSVGEEHVRLADDRAVRCWQAGAMPALVEVGWVRHLLAEPAMTGLEFDLSLHSRPLSHPRAERWTTARRLRAVEQQLAALARSGRPAVGSLPTRLNTERALLTRRLGALAGSALAVRQVSLWLAVRGPRRDLPTLGQPLVAALARLGFAPHLVRGRPAVERAWRAVGPALVTPPAATATLVPACDLAPLAWWAVAPDQPPAGWPVVTVSAEHTASRGPARLDDTEHLVVTGEAGSGAQPALLAWALTLALGGAAVTVLDAAGASMGLVEPGAGTAVWLGPGGTTGLDPVAADGYQLDALPDWTDWLAESDWLLERLLPGLSEGDRGALRAVLVELGLAWLERGAPLGLLPLWERLLAGGYTELADRLESALAGDWGWVVRPSRLPAWPPGLTVIGWPGQPASEWPSVAALAIRQLWRWRRAMPAAERRPAVLVVLDGQPMLTEPVTTEALLAVSRAGRRVGLRLWVDAGSAAGLARHTASRLLVANAAARATFRDAEATVDDLVDGLGWPAGVATLVTDLPVGMALVRTPRATQVARVAIADLVEQSMRRGMTRPWPATVMASD